MTERMTAAAFLAQQFGPKKLPRERGAQRVEFDGMTFDSKAEAARWQELSLLQVAGEISGLRRQVKIGLIGRDGPIMTDSGKQQRVYVADFIYVDHALGTMVVEDRKGHETEVFKFKRAVLAAQGITVVTT
ncbi:DUF1064 domain-containing protein [uncultured Tateyamaria sp.]|uniref:DUF1064 domain-containing protein n=1 Tax=uncultured Tateyamaria sp. TaxID=455651 RepID=UPI002613E239|nr:DUF1064 domain-containing protein [uncultured Tateyamaria sp.]